MILYLFWFIWLLIFDIWILYSLQFVQNEWRKGDSATSINNIWRLWNVHYTNQIPTSAAHLINYPRWAPQLASDHVRPLEAGPGWPLALRSANTASRLPGCLGGGCGPRLAKYFANTPSALRAPPTRHSTTVTSASMTSMKYGVSTCTFFGAAKKN